MICAHSLPLIVALVTAVFSPQEPDRNISILIHGAPLFSGFAAGDDVLIRLDDLRRQVEGQARRGRPLVEVRRNIVHVAESGGCGSCLLSVKRPGAIGPVHRRDRQPYVALRDIAGALGASIHVVGDSVYSLTCPAGECLGGILGAVR